MTATGKRRKGDSEDPDGLAENLGLGSC